MFFCGFNLTTAKSKYIGLTNGGYLYRIYCSCFKDWATSTQPHTYIKYGVLQSHSEITHLNINYKNFKIDTYDTCMNHNLLNEEFIVKSYGSVDNFIVTLLQDFESTHVYEFMQNQHLM